MTLSGPADRLLSVARAWFDEGTVARVFEPLIADGAHECATARGVARAVALTRLHTCFAITFALGYGRQMTSALPVGTSAAAWFQIELFWLAGAVVAYAPFYSEFRMARPALLLPSALALALPFALLPVAVLTTSNRQLAPWQARAGLARVLLVAVVAMVALTGWAVPKANQMIRNEYVSRQAGRSIVAARGLRELTSTELPRRHAIDSR